MPAQHRRDTRSAAAAVRLSLRRFGPLAVVGALAVLVLAMGWHRELSLENLVRYRATLDGFIADHIVAALAAFVALYVAIVALSLPVGAFLTMASGFLFGTLLG